VRFYYYKPGDLVMGRYRGGYQGLALVIAPAPNPWSSLPWYRVLVPGIGLELICLPAGREHHLFPGTSKASP
jgi:hypothetical protein